jgi:hypothetical protein
LGVFAVVVERGFRGPVVAKRAPNGSRPPAPTLMMDAPGDCLSAGRTALTMRTADRKFDVEGVYPFVIGNRFHAREVNACRACAVNENVEAAQDFEAVPTAFAPASVRRSPMTKVAKILKTHLLL